MMNQLNKLILSISKTSAVRSNFDLHLVRAGMVFMFYAFCIQKWNKFTAALLVPMISHSPIVFWTIPAFGVQGASYFLGTSEVIFGTLILIGYWNARIGILGALGSIVTFFGTTTILFFLPGEWDQQAGGFPIMTLPAGFLTKDVVLLIVSIYLLKQDIARAAIKIARS